MIQATIVNRERTLRLLFNSFQHAALFPQAQGYGLVAGFSNVAESSMASLKVNENEWRFGHVSYDLKNDFEQLESTNHDAFPFQKELMFAPQVLLLGDVLYVNEDQAHRLPLWLDGAEDVSGDSIFSFTAALNQQAYVNEVNHLIQEIKIGNIYEVTYSMEQSGELHIADPLSLFFEGHQKFLAPMSCLYKQGNGWLLCFSPERFLRIEGSQIMSQPIKGTARRGRSAQEDESNAQQLATSATLGKQINEVLEKLSNGL